MAKPLEVTWEYLAGDLRVHESEHLFGWDVVMSRHHEGRWYPTAILSRSQKMNGLEQRWARDWLNALLDEDYAGAVTRMQNLCEAPLD